MRLKNAKTCTNCGYNHWFVPPTAKRNDLGAWFDCLGGCGSTFLSHPKTWEEPENIASRKEASGHSYDVRIDDTPWVSVVIRNGDTGDTVTVQLGPSALKDLADRLFTAAVLLSEKPFWKKIYQGEENDEQSTTQ